MQNIVNREILALLLLIVTSIIFIITFIVMCVLHAVSPACLKISPICSVRTKVLPQYVEALRADGRVGF